MDNTFDVLVVGAGPGGIQAAIAAANLGKTVAIIERKPNPGGVSLHTGTLPSKALREAAYLRSRFGLLGMRRALAFNLADNNAAFLTEAIAIKNKLVEQQIATQVDILQHNHIPLIHGEASFHDAHTLKVQQKKTNEPRYYHANHIVLATGSRPRRPDYVPFDKTRVLDSSSLLKLQELPKQLIIVGGGVIACECATIFAPLGVNIILIDSHRCLLDYLDDDISSLLLTKMQLMGIDTHFSHNVETISRVGDEVVVHCQNHNTFRGSHLLYAVGRVPNSDGLNLLSARLTTDVGGWISVNEYHQSNQAHIYVIGDLAGRPALAATAMEQGQRVIAHAYQQTRRFSTAPLPMAIYTIPELSYVGLSERELQSKGINYVIGRADYANTTRGIIIGAQKGFIKILVDPATHKLLGVQIIGEAASELIHIGQMIMHYSGTVDDLAHHVYNFPTLAECYKKSAQDVLTKLR